VGGEGRGRVGRPRWGTSVAAVAVALALVWMVANFRSSVNPVGAARAAGCPSCGTQEIRSRTKASTRTEKPVGRVRIISYSSAEKSAFPCTSNKIR
jgi:hypothetical protein